MSKKKNKKKGSGILDRSGYIYLNKRDFFFTRGILESQFADPILIRLANQDNNFRYRDNGVKELFADFMIQSKEFLVVRDWSVNKRVHSWTIKSHCYFNSKGKWRRDFQFFLDEKMSQTYLYNSEVSLEEFLASDIVPAEVKKIIVFNLEKFQGGRYE